MLGIDCVGSNHYDRLRLSTKLSIICDDLGCPISIILNKGNVHDISLINSNLNNCPVDLDSTKYIIADKGYIGGQKYIVDKNIKLITPKRKNQKSKCSKFEKEKLSKRFIVEVAFSWFKKYKRLLNRQDKLSKYFNSFIYMGASIIISKKLTDVFDFGLQ